MASYKLQVHVALERCIQRGMSMMESVQLLSRLGVAPKLSMIGEGPLAALAACCLIQSDYAAMLVCLPLLRIYMQSGIAWSWKTRSSSPCTRASWRQR